MEPAPSSPRRVRGFRWSCFADAARGLVWMVKTQPNARFHAVATVSALALALWLGLTPGEWIGLLAFIGLVWAAEAINSAIELVVDMVSPEWREPAGWAKDVAAGAVLAAAITAAAAGALLFLPKLYARLGPG